MRIADGDEPKTTCITRYRAFEFLVMPFGLMNALAIFCMLMNQVFHEYLEKFVVLYLDDTRSTWIRCFRSYGIINYM